VIYNYKLVTKVYGLKTKENIVRLYEKDYKCTNYLCEMQGTYHPEDPCKLLCKEKNCLHFNTHHFGKCRIKCIKADCEEFENFHEGKCRIRCKWEECSSYGIYHPGKCVVFENEKNPKTELKLNDFLTHSKTSNELEVCEPTEIVPKNKPIRDKTRKRIESRNRFQFEDEFITDEEEETLTVVERLKKQSKKRISNETTYKKNDFTWYRPIINKQYKDAYYERKYSEQSDEIIPSWFEEETVYCKENGLAINPYISNSKSKNNSYSNATFEFTQPYHPTSARTTCLTEPNYCPNPNTTKTSSLCFRDIFLIATVLLAIYLYYRFFR
jgi:hypothetical protein